MRARLLASVLAGALLGVDAFVRVPSVALRVLGQQGMTARRARGGDSPNLPVLWLVALRPQPAAATCAAAFACATVQRGGLRGPTRSSVSRAPLLGACAPERTCAWKQGTKGGVPGGCWSQKRLGLDLQWLGGGSGEANARLTVVQQAR